jgi:hypothetical protein
MRAHDTKPDALTPLGYGAAPPRVKRVQTFTSACGPRDYRQVHFVAA